MCWYCFYISLVEEDRVMWLVPQDLEPVFIGMMQDMQSEQWPVHYRRVDVIWTDVQQVYHHPVLRRYHVDFVIEYSMFLTWSAATLESTRLAKGQLRAAFGNN